MSDLTDEEKAAILTVQDNCQRVLDWTVGVNNMLTKLIEELRDNYKFLAGLLEEAPKE